MAVQQQCLAADCAKIIFFMAEGTQRLPPSVVADLLRDSMAQGQKPYLTITSGSMRPLLHVGDEVQLEPVTLADLNEGDIITIAAPAALLTHRFWGWVDKEGQRFMVTRGDRFLLPDSPWAPTHLVGRVLARRRQRQVLHLRQGKEAWVGRYVARVAAAEGRLFSSWYQSADTPGYHKPRLPLLSFVITQIRRLIYLWVTLVVALASKLYRS